MSPASAKLVSWVSCFIVGVMVTLSFVTVFSVITGPIPIDEVCPNCTSFDEIRLAASIGRLDLIAMALTVLGIGLGFFAIFSFVTIRNDAKEAAMLAAERHVNEKYEQLRAEIINSLSERESPNMSLPIDAYGGNISEFSDD